MVLHAPDAAVVEDRLWSQRLERFAQQQLVRETLEWTPAEFALRFESLVDREHRASSSSSRSSLPRLLADLDSIIERSALLFAGGHSHSAERTIATRPATRALASILSHMLVLLFRLHCFLASDPSLPNQLLARVIHLWLNLHTLTSRRYSYSYFRPTDALSLL